MIKAINTQKIGGESVEERSEGGCSATCPVLGCRSKCVLDKDHSEQHECGKGHYWNSVM